MIIVVKMTGGLIVTKVTMTVVLVMKGHHDDR